MWVTSSNTPTGSRDPDPQGQSLWTGRGHRPQRLVAPGQDGTGLSEQGCTGFGSAHAGAAAHQQLRAGSPLQPADRLGQRRLADVQPVRRSGQRPPSSITVMNARSSRNPWPHAITPVRRRHAPAEVACIRAVQSGPGPSPGWAGECRRALSKMAWMAPLSITTDWVPVCGPVLTTPVGPRVRPDETPAVCGRQCAGWWRARR